MIVITLQRVSAADSICGLVQEQTNVKYRGYEATYRVPVLSKNKSVRNGQKFTGRQMARILSIQLKAVEQTAEIYLLAASRKRGTFSWDLSLKHEAIT